MQRSNTRNEVNMEIWTIRKLALLSIAALSLSACQQLAIRTQPQPAPKPVAEQPPPPESPPQPPPPPDSMPASRRVQKALQLLDLGDYPNARDQLTWALQEKPGLQIADKLIEQIDADPVEYLGMKNFYYRVESGDSLSIIAGKFLDDPMKFVILARYNKLENPSQLAPGDRIRVPGAMPDQIWQKKKKKVRPAKRPSAESAASGEAGAVSPTEGAAATTGPNAVGEETAPGTLQTGDVINPPQALPPPSLDQVLATAQQLHSAGELPAAIHELESEGSRYANTKAVQSLQIDYSREYADQLIKQDDLEGARGVLEKLILLDGSNDQTVNSLIRVEDKLESRKLYQRGTDLLGQDHVEEAYNVFTQALTYDPDNQPARQAQLKSRDKLTDTYHRLAMQHFRRQELDQAIALWNKILAIDPGHTLAAGYKARAVEMKQKLEQIDSGK